MDTRQTVGLLPQDGAQPTTALPGPPGALPTTPAESALASMAQAAQGTPLAPQGPTPLSAVEAAAPASQTAPVAVWFYESAGRTLGPVPESQILALIRAGSIQNHTLLWRQGLDDWTAARDVAEFNWAVMP